MIKKNLFITILLLVFFVGFLFFYHVQKSFFIGSNKICFTESENNKTERFINLYYYIDGKCKIEKTAIFYNNKNITENVKTVLESWLKVAYEEKFLNKKIGLQIASLSNDNTELYISFNSNLLSVDWSIYRKLTCIESLLKTLQNFFDSIHKVNFLVLHESMPDDHLDFSVSWPIGGFIEK